MTEREWRNATVPWQMLHIARARAGERKMRLFGCACCRAVLNEFAPGLAGRALMAAELFADGDIKPDTLARVRTMVGAALVHARREDRRAGGGYLSYLLEACDAVCSAGPAGTAAQDVALATARAAADVPWANMNRDGEPPELFAEFAAQCDLLRCIVGNPFAAVAFDPAWRTSDAVALARSMYEARDFTAMPFLADALQDAGCDNQLVLAHCRAARGHARGCWVCDAVLGTV